MQWININVATLGCHEFASASHLQRSLWLGITCYCVIQENGGRIRGAKKWVENTFRTVLHTSSKNVLDPSPLWYWKGEDLLVRFYPKDQESVHRSKVVGGKLGAKRRWDKKHGKKQGVPVAHPSGVPIGVPSGVPMGDLMRKEKEGKGREESTLPYGTNVQPSGERAEASGSPLSPYPPALRPKSSEAAIPTLQEVQVWANMQNVDPEAAGRYYANISERRRWLDNGRLIDWQSRFLRFWRNDQKIKIAPAADGSPAPREGWKIRQELEAVVKQLQEHACHAPNMGQQFTDEQRQEYEDLRKLRNALERELKMSIRIQGAA